MVRRLSRTVEKAHIVVPHEIRRAHGGGGGYNLELNWDVALQEHKPTGDRPREVDDPTFSLVSKQPTSPSNSQVV